MDGDCGIHSLLNGKPISILKVRQLLLERPDSRPDFRCIECGEAVWPRSETASLYYFQHLKWNRKCQFSEKLSRLQELSLKYPLAKGRGLSEAELANRRLSDIGRKGRTSPEFLELLGSTEMDSKYPLIAGSEPSGVPISQGMKRSRSKYPFDILNVGEARRIEHYIGQAEGKAALNRLQSAISTFKEKDRYNRKFKTEVILEPDGRDWVCLRREA